MSARSTSWPCPIAFEDATAIKRLVTITGNLEASAFALRLWHHRRRCGATVPGPDAEAVVELIAGQGRRRKGLAAHLRTVGLVADGADGSLVIQAWEAVAFVDWTRSGAHGASDAPGESPEERRRRLDRERKARRKQERNTPESGPDSARNSASVPTGSGAEHEAEREPERAEQSAEVPRNEAERSAEIRPDAQPDPRARTCATGTGTVTGTGTEEHPQPPSEPERGADRPADPPVQGELVPTGGRRPRPPKRDRGAELVEPTGDVGRVWTHYRERISPKSRCTRDRADLVAKWLKPRGPYEADELVRCIDGYAKSPHHNGRNERGTKYLSIELFLRDVEHIENGWKLLETVEPPPSRRGPAPYTDEIHDVLQSTGAFQ